MFHFSTTTQGLFSCFTRNKLKVVLSLGAISGLAACYTTYHTNPDDRVQLTICLTDDPTPAQCAKPLQVSVARNSVYSGLRTNYLTSYDASFNVSLPPSEWSLPSPNPKYKDVWLDFSLEPFSGRYARFSRVGEFGSGFGWTIHRTEGSLEVIKETQAGEAGSEFMVPRTGNQKIFFQCVKPFHAIAGNFVTDVGCQVTTEVQPFIFIQYGIKRKYLQDWQRINEQMVKDVQSAVQVNEGSKQWET